MKCPSTSISSKVAPNDNISSLSELSDVRQKYCMALRLALRVQENGVSFKISMQQKAIAAKSDHTNSSFLEFIVYIFGHHEISNATQTIKCEKRKLLAY